MNVQVTDREGHGESQERSSGKIRANVSLPRARKNENLPSHGGIPVIFYRVIRSIGKPNGTKNSVVCTNEVI